MKHTHAVTVKILGLGLLIGQMPIKADSFSPFNVINPGKWFDNTDDRGPYHEPPPIPPPGYGVPYGVPSAVGPVFAPPPVYVAPVAPMVPNPVPTVIPPNYSYSPAPINNYPATVNTPNTLPNYQNNNEPSREQMSQRIRELEKRLEEIEAQNRKTPPTAPPATPPASTYEYYPVDQTPKDISNYPFRPLDGSR